MVIVNELRKAGASIDIIEASKLPHITNYSIKPKKCNMNFMQLKGLIVLKFLLRKKYTRLQDFNISNHPSILYLVDVMIILCMRPAEVATLYIKRYSELDTSYQSADWYNPQYSWYYIGYVKNKEEREAKTRPFLSMEKNSERAKGIFQKDLHLY